MRRAHETCERKWFRGAVLTGYWHHDQCVDYNIIGGNMQSQREGDRDRDPFNSFNSSRSFYAASVDNVKVEALSWTALHWTRNSSSWMRFVAVAMTRNETDSGWVIGTSEWVKREATYPMVNVHTFIHPVLIPSRSVHCMFLAEL